VRSTLEIDDKLIAEATLLTDAKTKKEVVRLALEALVRQKRREKLRNRLGKFPLELTLKKLAEMREDA
jgi:Arc/MetJ family transcription regulator